MINTELSIKEKMAGLEKEINSEKLQQDTAEGLIDKSPFLGTVAEVLGEIPIIGILKKLDKCAGYVKASSTNAKETSLL